MKPHVALFKKKSKKLCLLLQAKILSIVVRCLHKEKDVKKKDVKKALQRKTGKVRVF